MNERYDFCFCSLRFGLGPLGWCCWLRLRLVRLGASGRFVYLQVGRIGQSGAGEYASTIAPLFLWDIERNYLLKVRERGSMVSWYINVRDLGSLKNFTELFLTPHKQRIEMGVSLST